MSVSKETIMQTLNLDETDDTALIPAYIESAQQYIINAVGSDQKFYDLESVESLFDTAVIALTSSYFTYRVALTDTVTYPINLTLNSIIGQLRGLYATYTEERMAKVRYLPSDFRFKADFGTYQSTPNKFTGVSVPKFVKQFTLHYKPHTRTLNQEYLAQQNGESDTRVIVIRHNAKVIEGQVAVLMALSMILCVLVQTKTLGLIATTF